MEENPKVDMSTMDSILKEIYTPALQDHLNSDFTRQLAEEAQARWNALPWHQKKWRLFKAEVRHTRRTIGYWIAGDNPNDY